MFHALVLIIFLILGFFSTEIFGQTPNARERAQEIAAALDKTKHKIKEKNNFRLEFYFDVRNEAIVKNAAEYAGVYESSAPDYRLTLKVAGANIEGEGYDTNFSNSARQNFTLKNAQINGALLTATKIYADGRTENFEAVFVNRTVSEGANPDKIEKRETKFGLGFIVDFGENSRARVICERKS